MNKEYFETNWIPFGNRPELSNIEEVVLDSFKEKMIKGNLPEKESEKASMIRGLFEMENHSDHSIRDISMNSWK